MNGIIIGNNATKILEEIKCKNISIYLYQLYEILPQPSLFYNKQNKENK